MFLLEAGRKANSAFSVPPPSARHTVSDATNDVLTMMKDLLETKTVQETDRSGCSFFDPSTKGMEEKVAKGWIEATVVRGFSADEDT